MMDCRCAEHAFSAVGRADEKNRMVAGARHGQGPFAHFVATDDCYVIALGGVCPPAQFDATRIV
jgi:hypothetical protein